MEKINTQILVDQFKKDMVGKDSLRGITLSYAWLANQFGHFTFGFLPSITLSLFFKDIPSIYFSLGVALAWAITEAFNLLIPILVFKGLDCLVFKPDWKTLVYDTITDVMYFVFGAMFSYFLIEQTLVSGLINIAIVLILFYPFVDWYSRRIYQQYAFFPIQFRLSQWEGSHIDETEKALVEQYIARGNNNTGNHMLIYGSVHEGKSNLGVAVANELALSKHTCTYITATRLYSVFLDDNENMETLWDSRTSKFLVIDDINPDRQQVISPESFLERVDAFEYDNREKNRELLKNKNIIWVLGVNQEEEEENWSCMLNQIGVQNEKISIINLSY